MVNLLSVPKTAGGVSAVNPAEESLLFKICKSSCVFCGTGLSFLRTHLSILGGEISMPNAKVLSEKQAIVADLTSKIKGAVSGVFVDYKGITVAEDTKMRTELREGGVDYSVVKNTLVRFALDDLGMKELDPILNGTTSLALSNDDPVAPARIINSYAEKMDGRFEIKGGFMDGKVMSLDEIKALAKIPSKPVLLAQVLGTMLAPITSLAIVLKAIAEKNGAPAEGEAAAE